MTSTFAAQMQGITISNAKVVEFAPPKMWWHNGVKQAKTPGTFYTRASEFPNGLPWTPEQRFDNEDGYVTETAKIAILAVRQQAFRKDKDDPQAKVEWLMRWEQGASIYTELLCLLEGHDGPVVWACKGLTGKAVTGKGGILQTYQNGLLKEAARVAGKALPLWTFWLPIASKRTADGKVAYEDTGYGSLVTPPALHLPTNAMDALFVGADVMRLGDSVIGQYPSWEQHKRLPAEVVEGEVVHAPALPAPHANRNIPISIDSVDEL